MEYVLLALLGLAIPVAWTAAFFLALGARSRVFALETKFRALELRLADGAGISPAPDPDEPDIVAQRWQATGVIPMPAPAEPAPALPPEDVPALPPEDVPAQASEPAHAPDDAVAAMDGVIPPSEPPPAEPSPPSAPRPDEPSLEERLGTRWVVWVGGIALAFGAIFLVRYSIEQGLIGPRLRIFFGALFAAALIAAGEWSRRKEELTGLAGVPQASIPAILTAAGTTAAYATVWSAYGLYGFISPGIAFILLGAVALATLAAALLHGPALAGLGLVGAYVTPLLVSSKEPSFWALYLYLAVVTAAAFALARMRLWRWLAITAVAASALWIFPGLYSATWYDASPHAFYVVVIFALAALVIVSGLAFGPEPAPDQIDEVSSATLAVYLGAATLLVLATEHTPIALGAFTLLTFTTVAIAWRAPAATGALPIAALLAALVIIEWAVQIKVETLLAPGGPVARDAPAPGGAQVGMHMLLGGAFAALFGGVGFLAQGRSDRAIIPLTWAGAAVIAPIAILIALYYRVAGFEQSIPFAALALLIAGLYGAAAEMLHKRLPRPGSGASTALFAVGAVASLALALTFALEKGWLTVALALMAPGIAWISEKRPLPLLRGMAAACAVLVCARILWEPRIIGADVGTTPILNWLLWGYGVPAISFWTAAYLLRRRADDLPARMLDSAAILFTVLTVLMEIRHYLTGGNIYAPLAKLAEVGMQVSALLAIAIGLERVRGRTQSPVHNVGAIIVALIALVVAVLGLLLVHNPLFNRYSVGGPFFNLILLGYGLPAVLAITLAIIAKDTRPMAYRAVAAAAAVTLALMYLSLQVRRFFQGPVLMLSDYNLLPTDAELWAYSAVWLAFGVVLLLLGILIRSQPARLASALVIFLTVIKVFLYDLAGIGGIWRSLSFIGLGLVLVGIGWLYQRLLFPRRSGPPPASAPEAPAAAS